MSVGDRAVDTASELFNNAADTSEELVDGGRQAVSDFFGRSRSGRNESKRERDNSPSRSGENFRGDQSGIAPLMLIIQGGVIEQRSRTEVPGASHHNMRRPQ